MSGEADGRLPEEMDALGVAVYLHDPETGAVVDGNETVEELYGYPLAELRELSVEEFSAASSTYSQAEAERRIRAAAAGDPQAFEWHVRRSNGELLWVRVRLSSVTIDRASYVLAEVRDLTEYKERERRLRLLYRVLRHNLRNQMNVVVGCADRLESAVEDERLESVARLALETAEEVGEMSDSVAEIEAITERDAAARSPTDLGALAESAAGEVRETFPDADVTVDVETEAWVNADEGLRYSVDHALENAVEHSDCAPVVDVTVTTAADGRALLRVADNGPPIPEMELDALDDETAITDVSHGSGLGLWLMQWSVESLGGELSFSENDPRGNVVEFHLPRVEPPPDAG